METVVHSVAGVKNVDMMKKSADKLLEGTVQYCYVRGAPLERRWVNTWLGGY